MNFSSFNANTFHNKLTLLPPGWGWETSRSKNQSKKKKTVFVFGLLLYHYQIEALSLMKKDSPFHPPFSPDHSRIHLIIIEWSRMFKEIISD